MMKNNRASWELFPAAAILERPFAVEDVTQDGRQGSRDDAGDDRFGTEHGERQRVEDREVEHERGATDESEFDEFMVLHHQLGRTGSGRRTTTSR